MALASAANAADEEIDEAAARLAEALRGSDRTTVEAVLSRVRSDALPPSAPAEARAESRVLDAQAAQRSVALYRTEASLHRLEAERLSSVLGRLEEAVLATDEGWRRSVMGPVERDRDGHLEKASWAVRTADEKEGEFVRLNRAAHSEIVTLMLTDERRYNEEFETALSSDGGKGELAAAHVHEVISEWERRAKEAEKPRQPNHASFGYNSSKYLEWLREEATNLVTEPSSFVSLVNELARRCDGIPSIAPVKGYKRTVQKAQDKYSGDFSWVLDLARGMVVFDRITDLAKALDVLAKHDCDGALKVLRAKDRLSRQFDASQSAGGYRDCLFNLSFRGEKDSEHVVELQFHLASFLSVKNGRGHVNYEAARSVHMFNKAFTTRSFKWEPDTDEGEVGELMRDIQEGLITDLNLDYSSALWSDASQQRLADVFSDPRCSLRSISLRSCRCGDNLIKKCLPAIEQVKLSGLPI